MIYFFYFNVMTDNVVEGDWVLVDVEHSLSKQLKQRGYMLWKFYKNIIIAYKIYRVVRMCIKLYIILHSHNINVS
jgi:hypothetical protein